MGKQHKRILLLLNFYYPRLHRGIMDYARTHQWDIETPYPRYLEESARNWRPKEAKYTSGVLKLYSQHAVSPMQGSYVK